MFYDCMYHYVNGNIRLGNANLEHRTIGSFLGIMIELHDLALCQQFDTETSIIDLIHQCSRQKYWKEQELIRFRDVYKIWNILPAWKKITRFLLCELWGETKMKINDLNDQMIQKDDNEK